MISDVEAGSLEQKPSAPGNDPMSFPLAVGADFNRIVRDRLKLLKTVSAVTAVVLISRHRLCQSPRFLSEVNSRLPMRTRPCQGLPVQPPGSNRTGIS